MNNSALALRSPATLVVVHRQPLLFPILLATLFGAARRRRTYVSDAICVFQVGNASGSVTFHQDPFSFVRLHGNITRLPQGKHGFHVHEYGDLSDGCASTGAHYNPLGMTHGGPMDRKRHVGDLGNIEADKSGTAVFNMTDRFLTLNGGHSIIGRALVVHADVDDLGRGSHNDSLTTGHSGSRIACCVIAIQPPKPKKNYRKNEKSPSKGGKNEK
ncbi:superoxide dismutase [Cu-Zn] isoform X1 [Rhipicephalus sanguineus]|uniref:superoxide dismutase [Cu-Zn] isoform X1 n=1 Tax=Rhipicephalus sanguineus TaxID=34632 RepID=UPI001894B775|nr:superoxide dismutase [Cu-Zn] isoform X1 [Rhipicephalus sanguineus]